VQGIGPQDALVRLKSLRSIAFTDTDESAPAGGIPILPLL
jgi:hypothetical protein